MQLTMAVRQVRVVRGSNDKGSEAGNDDEGSEVGSDGKGGKDNEIHRSLVLKSTQK
jgi:hypothetical protein